MKNKAFTLIELLIVIAITGILGTISVSTFGGYFQKAKLAKVQYFAKEVDTIIYVKKSRGAYTSQAKSRDSLTENNIFLDSPFDSSENSFGLNKLGSVEAVNNSIRTNLNEGITISAWIKIDGSSDNKDRVNVAFYEILDGEGFNIELSMNRNEYEFSSDMGVITSFAINTTSQFGKDYSIEGPFVKDNKWHHLLGAYDNKEKVAKFYFDGEKVPIQGVPETNNFPIGTITSGIYAYVEGRKGDNGGILLEM